MVSFALMCISRGYSKHMDVIDWDTKFILWASRKTVHAWVVNGQLQGRMPVRNDVPGSHMMFELPFTSKLYMVRTRATIQTNVVELPPGIKHQLQRAGR